MRMVEKVATAIDAAVMRYIIAHEIKARKDPTLKPCVGRADVPAEVLARAAIKAMREPTDEMVKAGVEFALSATVSGDGGWPRYVADKHRAMIDKAILESGE